jgi:two-component system response regulator HydG
MTEPEATTDRLPREAHGSGLVLVVDDEEPIRRLYRDVLGQAGYEVMVAEDALAARALLDAEDAPAFDAAVLDVMMPGESGLDLLVAIKKRRPNLPVIISTASNLASHAVFALKNGAFDYLIKPTRISELVLVVRNAVERGQMARELSVRRVMDAPWQAAAGDAVFLSESMRAVMGVLEMVKNSSVPVMILGETGTGKEVVARTLHARGNRKDKPFVAINCAALPRDLVESELFGHERGAFTGAQNRRVGRFEEAQGGTLLLDEVGELDVSIQGKLLRVLQEKEVTRVGGPTVKVDTRVVVATHRDLRAEVAAGRFREDLYYRLEVISLRLAPLRDRLEEIPALAGVLLGRFAASEKTPVKTLTVDALQALQGHTWPGNVRELENVLKRSALLTPGAEISAALLAWEQVAPLPPAAAAVEEPAPGIDDGKVRKMSEYEPELMLRALAETRGNVSEAAKRLGIGRATFYRRAKRYDLPL